MIVSKAPVRLTFTSDNIPPSFKRYIYAITDQGYCDYIPPKDSEENGGFLVFHIPVKQEKFIKTMNELGVESMDWEWNMRGVVTVML